VPVLLSFVAVNIVVRSVVILSRWPVASKWLRGGFYIVYHC